MTSPQNKNNGKKKEVSAWWVSACEHRHRGGGDGMSSQEGREEYHTQGAQLRQHVTLNAEATSLTPRGPFCQQQTEAVRAVTISKCSG